MSGTENVNVVLEEDEQEIDARYKPPPEKSIEEIVATDQEDESLRKYKEALLGEAKEGKIIVGKYYYNLYMDNLIQVFCLFLIKFYDYL